jgi:hypothetical protein
LEQVAEWSLAPVIIGRFFLRIAAYISAAVIGLLPLLLVVIGIAAAVSAFGSRRDN